MKLSQVAWREVGTAALAECRKDDVPGMAAEMAYHFLFALFPFALFLAALADTAGRLTGEDQLFAAMLAEAYAALPAATTQAVQEPLDAVLREQRGGVGGGVAEVNVTLPVVRELTNLLAARGVTVDVLPATVPPGYRADLFLAVHCDVNNDPAMRGYKLARSWNSPVAALDDQFIATMGARYAAATGLPRDPLITRAMSGYYAFNGEDYRHAIAAGTPAAIVELGFLTNVEDRQLLVSRPDLVAAALADGILRFLTRGP